MLWDVHRESLAIGLSHKLSLDMVDSCSDVPMSVHVRDPDACKYLFYFAVLYLMLKCVLKTFGHVDVV